MSVTDLSPYGTGTGLKTWSLEPEINNLLLATAEQLMLSTQNVLSIYGPFDLSKPNGAVLLTEAVYLAAEAVYFWRTSIKAIASPFRAERSGSYSYDKGARTTVNSVIEDHPILWPLVIHLKDNTLPMKVGTRLQHEALVNPVTGWRDLIIHAHSNRVQRAVNRLNIVSDTEEFNQLVYGDSGWYL